MEVTIRFNATGWIKQTVRLNSPVDDLEEGLNSGKYVTTVQEDGTVDITESGEEIGTVLDVDNQLEYEDFTVEPE